MKTVKTTFEIPTRVHARLKSTAGRLGVNARDLVVEGLELVLGRYDAAGDREELRARAAEASSRMRAGTFDGPRNLSQKYEGLPRAAEPHASYGEDE
ncbi:MAG: hypothetical protein QM817_12630 [Archangium sp.]